ncbi:hypothetical protein C2S51_036275 [Perilla frutescens var. frutescens]|nr:hypothetical protein C2S51_036275 [Perilla frutescens var. frutescens]
MVDEIQNLPFTPDINNAPAIYKEANLPVTLKFEDVVYRIKMEAGGMLKKKAKS